MNASQICGPWCEEGDIPGGCDLSAVKPSTLGQAMLFASNILFSLSGRRWPGTCTDMFRPCRSARGFCDRCGYGSSTIELPLRPVTAITSVTLDGVVVPPAEYRLDDRGWLIAVRQPNGQRKTWPCCQDLSRPTTETGTFEIEYEYGDVPPADAIKASALLAWEFAVAWSPDCGIACRLPQRVQTITRAGISMTMVDPLTMFDQGKTGISEVDLWLGSLRYGDSRSALFVDPARAPLGTRTTS